MKSSRSRRWASNFQLLDLACLILFYLIIAQIVSIGVAFHLKFDPVGKLDTSVASINQVVYHLRGCGGDLSDALTPEQVLARYQAAEGYACALTIHSMLTTPFDPAEFIMPYATGASKASQSFWETETSALQYRDAAKA